MPYRQILALDAVDWVVSDLGFIEVMFDNPFAIRLKLDEVVCSTRFCVVLFISISVLPTNCMEGCSFANQSEIATHSANRKRWRLVFFYAQDTD